MLEKQTGTVKTWRCDNCLKQFGIASIHMYSLDFCSWDCAHSQKGQKLIKKAEIARKKNRLLQATNNFNINL